MKKTALFTALLCLAQSTLHADVPLFINYQGKVADSTGLPIGASGTAAAPVAAPVNRKVIFRIYDAATGGNLLWTEEQTVTLSLGVFSVLLGNGINPTGTASTESRPPLDTIFTPSAASSRFLEIMVDNGDNSITNSDLAISPRQQITSTAFALHAKVADGIASATDLTINPLTGTATNYGLGWYGTGRLFNSVAVDGPVLYGNSGGALGSNASGTQGLALAWNAAGQVGVGAISSYEPSNKLTLQGDDSVTPARQLVIRGNTDSSKRLNIGFNTTTNQATLQSYTAASTSGNLLLNPSGGNVGIGNSSPLGKLTVNSGDQAITIGNSDPATGAWLRADANNTVFSTNKGDLYIGYSGNSKNLHFMGGGTTDAMTVTSSGNIGIGTSSPGSKLHLFEASGTASGASSASLALQHGNSGGASSITFLSTANLGSDFGYIQFQDALTVGGAGESNRLIIGTQNDPDDHICLMPSGFVGIRTTSPQAPLHVSGYAYNQFNLDYYYFSGGGIDQNANGYTLSPHSIIAEYGIQTNRIDINSDARIKNVLQLSNTFADLETLKSIKIKDYNYKDKALGTTPQKKVIAQDLEAVFPQAVSKSTAVVPDIFQKATEDGDWVKLATDLKVGERVRLISPKGEEIHEVLEVRPDAFRTSHRGANEAVFVYGREVKDFRSVDYDAIAMLNVSATQELAKQLKDKDAKIQALQDESASQQREIDTLRRELTATGQSLEARLIALEKRQSKGAVPETVSIKLGDQ